MTENYQRIRQVTAGSGDAVKAVLVETSDTRTAMRVVNVTAEDTRTVMRVLPVTESRSVDAIRMLIVDEATGTPIGPGSDAWAPADLGSALVADWDASVLANGAVASWTDSKAGLIATATAGLQPIKAATSFNSAYPGVTFDGVYDFLNITGTTGLPVGASPGELWAVANFVAVAAALIVVNYGSAGSSLSRTIRISNAAGGTVQLHDGTATSGAPAGLGNKITGGSFSGTAMNGYTNGTAHLTNPVTMATLATGATRLRIGGSLAASPTLWFNGTIARIFIINGVLAQADREKLEGYCAHTYGLTSLLPGAHPYKTVAP